MDPQNAPLDSAASIDTPNNDDLLRERIVAALKQIFDPEIPVNIYDLGLIYEIDLQGEGAVEIFMTLTTPGCPVAQTFPGMVEHEILTVPGVETVHVELIWDPPWTVDRMTEETKLELGLL